MIVDDSPILRKFVSQLLQKNGLKVLAACDGVEAMELIEAKSPDLVIVDILMPRMNGYELCRWLKNNPKTQDIPVVLCTVKDEQVDRYWGMKQGGDAYFAKYDNPAELLRTVIKLLLKSKSQTYSE